MPTIAFDITPASLDAAVAAWGWPDAGQAGETKAQFFRRMARDIIRSDVRSRRLMALPQASVPDIEVG